MLQQGTLFDYVIATGRLHTIRNVLEIAFQHVGLNYKDYILTDQKLYRQSEDVQSLRDPSKAKIELGWKPTVGFKELIQEIVNSDMRSITIGKQEK